QSRNRRCMHCQRERQPRHSAICHVGMDHGGFKHALPPVSSTPPRRPKNRVVARCNRTMTKLIRDPQLDELVKELNQRRAEEEPTLPSWPPALIPSGNPMEGLLTEMARRGAS